MDEKTQPPVGGQQVPTSNDPQLIQADPSQPNETTPIQPTPSQGIVPPQPPSVKPVTNEKPPKKERGILSLFVTIIIALVLVQVINTFFLQSYRVYGSSMFDTLENNDRLIISKLGKTTSKLSGNTYEPARADIIVFQSPVDENIQLIKRVIGLPGDRVVVANGKITVFNADNPEGFNPDDAEYGKDLPRTSGNVDVKVPAGHVFVSGDNREGSNSLDSRNELGTVPEENIVGKLKLRIWPLGDARFF